MTVLIEKNLHVSGLMQFKSMSFKGQLYFIAFYSDSNSKLG